MRGCESFQDKQLSPGCRSTGLSRNSACLKLVIGRDSVTYRSTPWAAEQIVALRRGSNQFLLSVSCVQTNSFKRRQEEIFVEVSADKVDDTVEKLCGETEQKMGLKRRMRLLYDFKIKAFYYNCFLGMGRLVQAGNRGAMKIERTGCCNLSESG